MQDKKQIVVDFNIKNFNFAAAVAPMSWSYDNGCKEIFNKQLSIACIAGAILYVVSFCLIPRNAGLGIFIFIPLNLLLCCVVGYVYLFLFFGFFGNQLALQSKNITDAEKFRQRQDLWKTSVITDLLIKFRNFAIAIILFIIIMSNNFLRRNLVFKYENATCHTINSALTRAFLKMPDGYDEKTFVDYLMWRDPNIHYARAYHGTEYGVQVDIENKYDKHHYYGSTPIDMIITQNGSCSLQNSNCSITIRDLNSFLNAKEFACTFIFDNAGHVKPTAEAAKKWGLR